MGSIEPWLLDSDPSIRWQVMREVLGEPDAGVARERSQVVSEGWGARLLDLQAPNGHWGASFVPRVWISTKDTLQLLRDFGVGPASERVRRAIGKVEDQCTWGAEFGTVRDLTFGFPADMDQIGGTREETVEASSGAAATHVRRRALRKQPQRTIAADVGRVHPHRLGAAAITINRYIKQPL